MDDKKLEKKIMNRRTFLEQAGKVGAGAIMASIPVINSCKDKGPNQPEPPVPITLDFKVYNHTQGLQTEFSEKNVVSGTKRNLSVSDIISKYGVKNVDEKRIALRKANFGSLIQYSNTGLVEFEVPNQNTYYDVFLLDAAASALYEWMETANYYSLRLQYPSTFTAFRRDLDSQTGEERVWGGEFIPEIGNYGVFDQYNELLHPNWANFTYGSFNRKPDGTSGTFSYGFGNCGGEEYSVGIYSDKEGVVINPNKVSNIAGQVSRGLGVVLELILGQYTSGIGGQEAYETISSNGNLTPLGKSLIAYLFVSSSLARNK
jgi:hypothetical protein